MWEQIHLYDLSSFKHFHELKYSQAWLIQRIQQCWFLYIVNSVICSRGLFAHRKHVCLDSVLIELFQPSHILCYFLHVYHHLPFLCWELCKVTVSWLEVKWNFRKSDSQTYVSSLKIVYHTFVVPAEAAISSWCPEFLSVLLLVLNICGPGIRWWLIHQI